VISDANRFRTSSDAMEPLAFAILAGCTPKDCQVELYDERLEEIPERMDADLVAITIETFTARRAYQLASRFADQGVPVVAGGYHTTFCAEETLRYVRSVVLGDADDLWPEVVQDAKNGTLKRKYQSQLPKLSDRRIDRSIFRGKRYRPVALVQFGRGCRYACDFCSIHAFYGTSLRWRPVSEVVQELSRIDRPYVFFTDDNLFNNKDHLKELLEAIRPLKLRWSCQCSIDIAADQELLGIMARSGCISLMIGFESLDPNNLKLMRKAWNQKHGSYSEMIRKIRDHGMMIYGGFVLGYDHDTPDVFDATLDFAIRNRLFLANFNPLTPTPGSSLYARLKSEGRLIRDPWWLDPEFKYGDCMFEPKKMTPEQLQQGCYRIRTEFNRWRSIGSRALDWRANCRTPLHAAAYALANFTSRREIHRKQGMRLGDSTETLREVYPPDDTAALGTPA
jgi:radical SAM superfamily enzyme YgiQ (UPF0313 family)